MKIKTSSVLTVCSFALLGLSVAVHAATWSSVHTFGIDDVLDGEVNGVTFADDNTIICGIPNGVVCPPEGPQPKEDNKGGFTLYPINAGFGYRVSDFVGAELRERGDNEYKEGFAGNIEDADYGPGIATSNTETSLFKVRDPYGTWCMGVGGSPVKCSSEHYVVMEHVLTCHQINPYTYINPLTGEENTNCIDKPLDDVLRIVREFDVNENSDVLTTVIPIDFDPVNGQMWANESTVRNDIAVGKDYSITLKDDGKPLYRWGNAVKRPTEMRLYARMALPMEWKVPDANFRVNSATLRVEHTITNNPNDQLRPEDMENEEATGRLPGYDEASADRWTSRKDCYEGDGDYIPNGTLLKDSNFGKIDGFSEDRKEGFTNAWYTTIDRDPFEDVEANGGIWPRWRLRSNKFGQNLPSLEIPTEENACTPPPYKKGGKKYETGDFTVTTIDLLDWETDVESPLVNSRAWVNAEENSINELSDNVPGVSINGLPLSEDFDLAVYVKGDKKAVKIYNATLNIEWDDVPNE